MVVAYLIATNGAQGFSGGWFFVDGGTINHRGFVIFYGEAVRASIEIDAEATIVSGVGSRVGRTNLVAANDGAGLVAERIDAAGVIELTGIVADIVTLDAVVLHTCVERCPSPTDADARVAEEKHVVLADGAVAYIAQCNAHGAPVFVGCIYNEVFLDGQSLTALGQVGVGTVYLARTLCKGTAHNGCSANCTTQSLTLSTKSKAVAARFSNSTEWKST